MSDGRKAHHPGAIPRTGWWDILYRVWGRMGATNLSLIAAGIAFFGLLSLFPGMTAAVAIAGLIFDPDLLAEHTVTLAALLPDSARELVLNQLNGVLNTDSTSLSLAAMLALGLAIYSASRAVANFIIGLNIVYEETETRNLLALTALNMALTVALIVGLLLSLLVVAALPVVAAWFENEALRDLVELIRWPFLMVTGAAGISVLFRYGPDRRNARWRWLTPGAGIACILWVAGSIGFSLYVQTFGTYNETFGALAGVIVLLTWLWLSAFIVLLGALLDAEVEAQTSRDSTVGPDRPRGQRGAVKADEIGESRG